MNISRLTFTALFATVILVFSSFTRASEIYVLSDNSSFLGGPTNFGKINTATGAYTSIRSIDARIHNLAWNPVAGNFFVTDISGVNNSFP
jgi:hypothetical protein